MRIYAGIHRQQAEDRSSGEVMARAGGWRGRPSFYGKDAKGARGVLQRWDASGS
jgi:hypothetical protein